MQTKLILALVALSAMIGAYFYGVSVGKEAERGKWMKAELERSQAFSATLLELQDENQKLTERNAAIQAAAEQDKAEQRRLSNEIDRLIDRTPTVRTVEVEVPANCPVVECPVPDIAVDFRLHNCAVDPASCTVPDPVEADRLDDAIPIT